MRKLIALLLLLLAVHTASAQESKRIVVDRNMTLSGTLYAFTKEEEIKDENFKIANEGVKWHIKNMTAGGENYVSFWIETPSGSTIEYNSWKEHGVAVYIVKDDGKTNYVVKDDTFSYLRMVEINGKHAVQLCTLMLQ